MDITCVTGGNGQLLFADSEGGVTISNQDYSLSRFQAHQGCINNCLFVDLMFMGMIFSTDLQIFL